MVRSWRRKRKRRNQQAVWKNPNTDTETGGNLCRVQGRNHGLAGWVERILGVREDSMKSPVENDDPQNGQIWLGAKRQACTPITRIPQPAVNDVGNSEREISCSSNSGPRTLPRNIAGEPAELMGDRKVHMTVNFMKNNNEPRHSIVHCRHRNDLSGRPWDYGRPLTRGREAGPWS